MVSDDPRHSPDSRTPKSLVNQGLRRVKENSLFEKNYNSSTFEKAI
jgi:hypothetical protein